MAWTVPRTWSAGELVTASIMNTHVRDNLNAFSTQLWTWTGDQTFNDNVKTTYGTGGDADVYYDGTNLVIDPQVVGSGGVDFDGCDIAVDGTKKVHLSGLAGDTYIYQISSNVMGFIAGAVEILRLSATVGPVFNEGSVALDFRIEGNSLDHMLFLDGSLSTENIALLESGAPNWQTMDRGVFFGNVSTAPTGNPSGGGFLYVVSGALTWRGSSGTITTLGVA